MSYAEAAKSGAAVTDSEAVPIENINVTPQEAREAEDSLKESRKSEFRKEFEKELGELREDLDNEAVQGGLILTTLTGIGASYFLYSQHKIGNLTGSIVAGVVAATAATSALEFFVLRKFFAKKKTTKTSKK